MFTIKKTENEFLPSDRKVRLCLCHGLTIPTSFDLKKGNNVIFIVNSGYGFTELNFMTEKLCYLLGINNFDLANIFNINEYYKIKESNSNEILTSEHLTPPFMSWQNEYKYYREQRLQKNNIKQGELIENPYVKGSELICDYFEFKGNNTYGDIEFKLHIGGEGKKCPDITLDFKEEEIILMGVLDKLEENVGFENFNKDLREKLKDKLKPYPGQSTIYLSKIFENYTGTVFAVCCRKFLII